MPIIFSGNAAGAAVSTGEPVRKRARARGRWPARWLAPDLAMVAAAVTLFFCLFLFEGYSKLFRDSDTGWHIRTGEAIIDSGQLPKADPYSFTRAGQPWFAWEWASDVLMGAADRAGGLTAVALLYGVAIAAGVWLWFRLNWAVQGNFLLACALAAPMLSTSNIHWLARPHVLSWIFLLAALLFAQKFRGPLRSRHIVAIVALTAVWTNVHASFFLAPAIAFIYAAASFLRPLIWDVEPDGSAGAFAMAGVCAGASTLINPYGWHLHGHVFRYLFDTALLDRIGEFQSFNFHAEGAFQILLTLGIAAFGGVLALGQKKLAHFFLAVLIGGMALRSARALPLVALLLLPLANGAIAEMLSTARGLRPGLRRGLDGFLRYGDRLRILDARRNGMAWAPVIVLAMFVLLRVPGIAARTGFPADQFPVTAAERVPRNARLLAPDKFGGYLIFRFAGHPKVFFDGRSDLYGADFLKQYARLVQVRPGWREQLGSYRFTHALLPNDYSLIPALEQLGWKRIYRDGTATLLENAAS